MSFPKTILAVLAIAALVACGGGKSATQNAASQSGGAMKNASGSMMNGASNAANGAMSGTTATVPADVHCGAVQPVWVNTRTHVYHLAGDPSYGHTKMGKYMCPSAAAVEGDRPAGGSSRHHRRGSSNSMQDSNSTDNSGGGSN